MVGRMMWLLCSAVLWDKVLSNPRCEQVSRSGVTYKYPYQQTKTILYQLPYQQTVPPKPEMRSVYDSYQASTVQQFPVIHHPNSLFGAEAKESVIQLQHIPNLSSIHQHYQTTQPDLLARDNTQSFAFSPGYLNFLPAASASNNYFTPQNFVFNPVSLKSDSSHGSNLNPYHIAPLVPANSEKQLNKIVHQHPAQLPQNYHIYSPTVKAAPLVYSQVYHPVYPPQAKNMLKLPGPPNAPRYLTHFHPMVPVAPVAPAQDKPEKEEQKEEAHDDPENNEEDREEADYKKDYDFDDKFYKNSKYSFPSHFHSEDREDDEKDSYKVEDREDEDEESDDPKETMKSYVVSKSYPKLSTKLRPEKLVAPKQVVERPKSIQEQQNPKTEIKMVRYTKSLNTPQREYIESTGSESVPIIHKSKQSFHENWYITKSTREQ